MRPARKLPLILGREPPELLIADEIVPCPYIEGQRARMPLRMPLRAVNEDEWDLRLDQGDRRHGVVFYRTACPECVACEPIRVDVRAFRFSRNHRRVLRKGRELLDVELGPPVLDERRIELYERHLERRGLRQQEHQPISAARFRNFLVESSVPTIEIRYLHRGEVVGAAITDRSQNALSAHYTYYDPTVFKLGLGTFSILTQLELCRQWELDYLYLGLFIGSNDSMKYKARFRPHERKIDGEWVRFE